MSYVIALAWPVAVFVLGYIFVSQIAAPLIAYMTVNRNIYSELGKCVTALQKQVATLAETQGVQTSATHALHQRAEKLESALKVSPPAADKHTPQQLARFR